MKVTSQCVRHQRTKREEKAGDAHCAFLGSVVFFSFRWRGKIRRSFPAIQDSAKDPPPFCFSSAAGQQERKDKILMLRLSSFCSLRVLPSILSRLLRLAFIEFCPSTTTYLHCASLLAIGLVLYGRRSLIATCVIHSPPSFLLASSSVDGRSLG